MKNTYTVNKVLVPIDFSEASKLALEYSSQFCEKFNAQLHLMHVVSAGSYDKVLPDVDYSARGERLSTLLKEKLSVIANKYSSCNPKGVQVHLAEGKISREIVRISKEIDADLILMGTHGVSGFEEFFIGSNAYRVVTAASCPVLSVQEKAKGLSFKNIALCFDNTIHTRDKVAEATAFAKKFGSTIQIAGLVTEEAEEGRPQLNLKIKQVEEYLDEHHVNYVTQFIKGDDVAEMSMEFAKRVKADLLVIMTEQEARTGLFMGPAAQRVVNHSRIPVLSVTPLEVVRGFSQKDLEGGYRPLYIYEQESEA